MAEDPQHKVLTMTILVTPDMANFAGNAHGGALLKLLDQVAYACASRYCGSYVMTISVDQVFFRERVHVGELVSFISSINYTGNTSMEVGIRVTSENIRTHQTRHVMTCYFTMVAVNEYSEPTKVPQLVVTTDVERRRWAAAKLRRDLRKEVDARSMEIRLHPEDFDGPGAAGQKPAS